MDTDRLVDHYIIFQKLTGAVSVPISQLAFVPQLANCAGSEPPLAVGALSQRCLAMQRQSRANGLDEGPMVSGTGFYPLLTRCLTRVQYLWV